MSQFDSKDFVYYVFNGGLWKTLYRFSKDPL